MSQDHRGAREGAEFLLGNSPLQEVGGSFRLHDLLLDSIVVRCQGEDALVKKGRGTSKPVPWQANCGPGLHIATTWSSSEISTP